MNERELEALLTALGEPDAPCALFIRCAEALTRLEQYAEAKRLLATAIRRWPEAHQLQLCLGELELAQGDPRAAAFAFASAAALAPSSATAQQSLSRLLKRDTPTWHFPMMNDVPRNEAFDQAIRAQVSRPGMRVLDIGCGGGLLSLMAARAGAEVIACEISPPLIPVAREIFQANGYSDQIKLFERHSTALNVGVELDQPAELLICEIFDVSLLGEDALHSIQHARRFLLSPEAKVLPAAARLWALPVESKMLRDRFHVSESVGFEISAFNQLCELRPLQLEASHFEYRGLSSPILAMEIDLDDPEGPALSGAAMSLAEASEDGRFDGILFWYELILDREQEIILSTAPDQPGTHWRQCFFPTHREVRLSAGEPFQLVTQYRRYWLDFKLIGGEEA